MNRPFNPDITSPFKGPNCGTLAERPTTAEDYTLYLAFDDSTGKVTVYYYHNGWHVFKGVNME